MSVQISPFVKKFLGKNKPLLIMVHLTTTVNLVCVWFLYYMFVLVRGIYVFMRNEKPMFMVDPFCNWINSPLNNRLVCWHSVGNFFCSFNYTQRPWHDLVSVIFLWIRPPKKIFGIPILQRIELIKDPFGFSTWKRGHALSISTHPR
jgi:hypothetical protein